MDTLRMQEVQENREALENIINAVKFLAIPSASPISHDL